MSNLDEFNIPLYLDEVVRKDEENCREFNMVEERAKSGRAMIVMAEEPSECCGSVACPANIKLYIEIWPSDNY